MRIDYAARELEPQLRGLWKLSFDDSDDMIGAFFSTAYALERCRCITVEDRVAAALYWFDTECRGRKYAYLYAVATHPKYRRQGLCRALMADAHRILTQRGYEGALLMPAEAGLRRMYGAMGYRDCGGVSEFSCGAGVPVPLRAVSAAEFAGLRRSFLPEGGVIQEKENLSYLASYAAFYAGTDFLLAACQENGQLRGLELLGNREAAPGIVSALGFAQGVFRTPGDSIPFAMFRPLKAGRNTPAYFGLAFD